MQHIAVIGAGSWGTALALTWAKAGQSVTLWARDPALAKAMQGEKRNPKYLSQHSFPPSLKATAEAKDLHEADVVVLTIPTQHLRSHLPALLSSLKPQTPLVIAAKGIEQDTHLLLPELAQSLAPGHPIGMLSGPNFAAEIANGLPAATTLALADQALGEKLLPLLATPQLRPYLAHDVTGVALGGALKNVIAIASGIVLGQELGDNARAALISRGLEEISRLGMAMGAQARTFMGLSGLGDLLLTCGSLQSRNLRFGQALGQGYSVQEAEAQIEGVIEGKTTAKAVLELAKKKNIAMPIAEAVYAVVYKKETAKAAVQSLLGRPLKREAADF
ncbi:MAG: NAD(P)H-dependent glycerol-3-phosphate dehydrogenase [Dongiaceae bacterium]